MRIALIKRCMTWTSVCGGLAALVLSLTSGTVLAQDDEIEEITVTGSRIARDPNLSGALPVQSVDEQQIQMSGEFALSDVVNDIPALLSSTTSESSIDSGTFTDGANVLNLRGLGANRTLVLVDRVEVLSGGASAIYGADAVTGVVNFIMKDNFEGFNVDASYGLSSEGDAGQSTLTATCLDLRRYFPLDKTGRNFFTFFFIFWRRLCINVFFFFRYIPFQRNTPLFQIHFKRFVYYLIVRSLSNVFCMLCKILRFCLV